MNLGISEKEFGSKMAKLTYTKWEKKAKNNLERFESPINIENWLVLTVKWL